MDGILSQDEINALLSGMDTSGGSGEHTADTDHTSDTEMSGAAPYTGGEAASIDGTLLSDAEKDAIGEVANISMGSSATTLYSLVNQKVNITTPQVELTDWKSVTENYERPCVFIQIKYTAGLEGSNILILKEHDVMVITDLMMGGDGTDVDGTIGDLQLSAISEAMNQMMGASATSLSTMIDKKVDISPPMAMLLDLASHDPSEIAEFLAGTFVRITFKMQISDLVDSTLMQLYPVDFAKSLYTTFVSSTKKSLGEIQPTGAQPQMTEQIPPMQQAMPMQQQPMQQQAMQMQQQPMQMQQQPMQPQMQPQMQQYMQQGSSMSPPPMQNMNVEPAQFQTFASNPSPVQNSENIGLISDVPLEVTVELGRTKKSISDILSFAPGTIIELDKVAGEPVDILVNGKLVAKGEVVVIEESFGVRVTEIIGK